MMSLGHEKVAKHGIHNWRYGPEALLSKHHNSVNASSKLLRNSYGVGNCSLLLILL